MRILIDGTDITDFIAYQGLKVTRSDIDGPNAGRNLAGTMLRDRVATKLRFDITCRPLHLWEIKILNNLLMPEYVSVQSDEPTYGNTTMIMYSNNNSYEFCINREGDDELWHNINFPLIEK